MSKRIILADKQQMFADGLNALIGRLSGIDVCAVCTGRDALSDCIKQHHPDAVIINAGIAQNIDLYIKKLHDTEPEMKILILSDIKDYDFLYKVYSAGISAFVLKTSAFTVLEKALKVVFEDGVYIEPVLIPFLKERVDKSNSGKNEDCLLTKREMEILFMVSQGLYNKEIAYNLGIKEKTVKNHMTNLFKKINVEDRIQAAVYAVKNGYANLD